MYFQYTIKTESIIAKEVKVRTERINAKSWMLLVVLRWSRPLIVRLFAVKRVENHMRRLHSKTKAVNAQMILLIVGLLLKLAPKARPMSFVQ